MSRPRFLTNHDLNEDIIHGVLRREPAIEILRAREAGLSTSPDPEVLAFAAREQWIVLSHDVNTMTATAVARLSAGQPLSGLFLIKQRAPVATAIEELILVWAASEMEEWQNQVQFLPF